MKASLLFVILFCTSRLFARKISRPNYDRSKGRGRYQEKQTARQSILPTLPVLPNGAPCTSNVQCASGCCVCAPTEWYSNGYCTVGICVTETLRGQICGLLNDDPLQQGIGRVSFLTQGGVISGGFMIESGKKR